MLWKRLSEGIAWKLELALINMTIQYRLLVEKFKGEDTDKKPFSEIPEGIIQLNSREIFNERSLSRIEKLSVFPDSEASILLEVTCLAQLKEDWLSKLWFQIFTPKKSTDPIFYIVKSVDIDDLKCTLIIIPYNRYWLRKAKKAINCADDIFKIRIISPDNENRTRIFYHENGRKFIPADI